MVILPLFFINFFYFFDVVFFSGQITIRIDTLWAQLLLEFSTDHFETMHTCSTWSVDVHVVLGISFHFFLSTFFTFYSTPHNSGGVLWFNVGRPCVCPSVRRSVVRPSVRFSFPDDNLSEHQWIFTKLGIYIDIVERCFGIANGQISSNFYWVICPRHAHIFVSGR